MTQPALSTTADTPALPAWHALGMDDTIALTQTRPEGPATADATMRLQTHGQNLIPRGKDDTALDLLWRQINMNPSPATYRSCPPVRATPCRPAPFGPAEPGWPRPWPRTSIPVAGAWWRWGRYRCRDPLFAGLEAGGVLVQFTYSPLPPIGAALADALGVSGTCVARVFSNLPPAAV